jgi:hypothetical protein
MCEPRPKFRNVWKQFLIWRSVVAQTKEGSDAASVQAGDATGSPAPVGQLLFASAVASAQSFALLAVPSHAQTRAPAEAVSVDDKLSDKPTDPISEAGSLAAADAMLMGGLLGDW